jgi:DNA-binding transcriptional MerR regulator
MKATTPQLSSRALRIGELAERTGRSVHAIRWYETQGLIPGVIRDAGGRRSYRERHFNWLILIDRLRLTGMSIAQIREYASLVTQGRGTIKQQAELLRQHRVQVRATIEEWERALKLLDTKIEYFEEWVATGQRPHHQTSGESSGKLPRLTGGQKRKR